MPRPASLVINADTPIPEGRGQRLAWVGLPGRSDALALTELGQRLAQADEPKQLLVITEDSAIAQTLVNAMAFFSDSSLSILQFPDWETLPYDAFSPHQDITSERLATLRDLPQRDQGALVVPVTTLLQRIAPAPFIAGSSFAFAEGTTLDVAAQRVTLDAAGYQNADTVVQRGQYAVRGSVMDIFPMGAPLPVRIDLFDNEIDTLRTFDPDTQRTIDRIEALNLLPAKEFPFDDDAIRRFRGHWHEQFDVDVRRCAVYQDVSNGIVPNGVEYYLPLFFDTLGTLFDYLTESTLVVLLGDVFAAVDAQLNDVGERYESLRHDIERPILPPHHLFLAVDELHRELNRFPSIHLTASTHSLPQREAKHRHDFHLGALPELVSHGTANTALKNFIADGDTGVLFVAETAGRREVFDEVLSKAGIQTKPVAAFGEYVARDDPATHAIAIGQLTDGLQLDGHIIVTETDVLGTRQTDHSRESGRIIDPDQIVRNLTELSIGAPVVHIEHGVGRYLGLQLLTIDGASHEFLTLAYADDDKLYVPVTSLHLISRYAGSDEEHAPLHRLGSDQWEKAKRRAAEKVVDVAAELLDIYARRELRTSIQFPLNEAEYVRFADEFPFEVTTDQQRAIDDSIADLTQLRAMDRLICGDVGFGKTEVAMRAAFIAVQAGYQVAVLVPTTLLAQQHFDTFKDRFAAWPVQIEAVSRLRADAHVADVASRAAAGKVDVLIGTHKLLSDAFTFKQLGLIIIDEEHRFGVRQKERLKRLRAEVDVLTLTATPIPRTLNLAISGIRDLSIIATPPAKRLSINTFVQEKHRHQVKEAISRELHRGGQVFYLHNEVRTIEQTADALAELVPQARIGIGHGQMPKRQLEQVMADFYHRNLNVLVCTTIIETGIDIPNANTIVIERADKFGLAQLHQLRGRVGRSHRQAYAYLLTPHPKAMTSDAVKRLDAIEAAGELGVGFTLATHDMEIRGAGELLGEDQSGQIESIGFSLYMDLLNRAVESIRAGTTPNLDDPLEPVSQEVNLHAATLIPEHYLPDVHTRLIQYKRISNAANQDKLDDLQIEMIDRFGLLPEPLKRLFAVTSLKLASAELGIVKIDLGQERGKLEFNNEPKVDPIKIVNLVQQQPSTFKLQGASVLRTTRTLPTFEERLAFCYELFEIIAADGADTESTAKAIGA